jgi:hypothetical protein
MDYLFCTVFAWKLTNKKFETVAIWHLRSVGGRAGQLCDDRVIFLFS